MHHPHPSTLYLNVLLLMIFLLLFPFNFAFCCFFFVVFPLWFPISCSCSGYLNLLWTGLSPFSVISTYWDKTWLKWELTATNNHTIILHNNLCNLYTTIYILHFIHYNLYATIYILHVIHYILFNNPLSSLFFGCNYYKFFYLVIAPNYVIRAYDG